MRLASHPIFCGSVKGIDIKANAVPDPDFPGGFKATATVPIPADAIGSGSALIEGRPTVDVDGNGTRERIPVDSAGMAFAITDTAPAAQPVWPTIDLFDEIGNRAMRSPNTAVQLMASILSFSGVEVPWALI